METFTSDITLIWARHSQAGVIFKKKVDLQKNNNYNNLL